MSRQLRLPSDGTTFELRSPFQAHHAGSLPAFIRFSPSSSHHSEDSMSSSSSLSSSQQDTLDQLLSITSSTYEEDTQRDLRILRETGWNVQVSFLSFCLSDKILEGESIHGREAVPVLLGARFSGRMNEREKERKDDPVHLVRLMN